MCCECVANVLLMCCVKQEAEQRKESLRREHHAMRVKKDDQCVHMHTNVFSY